MVMYDRRVRVEEVVKCGRLARRKHHHRVCMRGESETTAKNKNTKSEDMI